MLEELLTLFRGKAEDPKPNSPPVDDSSEPTINVDKDDESPVPPMVPSTKPYQHHIKYQ